MITIIHGFAGSGKTTKLKTFETDNSLWISDFKELCKKIDFKARGINLSNEKVKSKFLKMHIALLPFKERFKQFLEKNKIDLVLFDNMELFPAGFARMILSVAKNSVCVFDKGFPLYSITANSSFKNKLEFDEIIELNKTYIPQNIMKLGLDILGVDKNVVEYPKQKGRIAQNFTKENNITQIFLFNKFYQEDEHTYEETAHKRFDVIKLDIEHIFFLLFRNDSRIKSMDSSDLRMILYKMITRANKKLAIKYSDVYCKKSPFLRSFCKIEKILKEYVKIDISPILPEENYNNEDDEELFEFLDEDIPF